MSTITYREGLSGQEIRLLRLLPGEWLEDLVAELYVADRDQDYVALSYAWGSTRRSNKIIVNRHVHFITFNLDRALRAIRRTTGSIVIWVDSVCINQEDAVEKSHQVGLMHDIFGSATEVIAYVGDGLDRSRQDYPRRFARLGLADPVRFTGKRTDLPVIERSISLWQNSTSGSLTEHEEMLCLYGIISAQLHESLTHPAQKRMFHLGNAIDERRLRLMSERIRLFAVSDWWNRMWIIQEACVAKELTIMYGRVSMPFSIIGHGVHDILSSSVPGITEFAKVVSFLAEKADAINFLRVTRSYKSLPFANNSPLLWLLRNFRNRRSSEPRDKIFALLRLARNFKTEAHYAKFDLNIDTDYKVSVHTLFAHVAYEIIKQTGLFWVTTFDLLAKSRNDVPSWVPDWSSDYAVPGWNQHRVRLHGELFQMFNASRARFLHSQHDGLEDLYVLPQQHFQRLADGDLITGSNWQPIHHLPAQVAPVPPEAQPSFVLTVSGAACGEILGATDPLASDFANLGEILYQIITICRLFKDEFQLQYRKPFVEIISRILSFSARTQRSPGGYRSPRWLSSTEETQLSFWVLVRFLASPFANYWPRKESYSEDDIMIWDKHLQEDEECSLRISECIGDPPLFWTISSQAEIPASDDDLSLPLFTFTSDFNLRTDQKDVKSTRTWQEDESWVEGTIRAVASGSRLFVTSKGQLGLGPEKTRTGDAVCILEGGLMPHVLRKRSEKRGVTMVGTCYVEGLMHWGGEAGYHADNARDTEGLEHKLRRRLRDRDISEEDFLLY
ncbi:Heterokaryon incompatibility protein 6, OR allele [Colletotrichum siamense]|uniref:Heterokaryon incompatibility protein 6, OR allele n=1 Tax=Colletotrichum siamense TaxID=690259 RepID=UPI00187256BB|nr:Heterokaryon incompatibility protein 6, OR allele [Colletotrichum siamense]KAF5500937.1 Heterokaryon incompatibility protein 6, OR allele [Colletotrichum siamense]